MPYLQVPMSAEEASGVYPIREGRAQACAWPPGEQYSAGELHCGTAIAYSIACSGACSISRRPPLLPPQLHAKCCGKPSEKLSDMLRTMLGTTLRPACLGPAPLHAVISDVLPAVFGACR